MQLKTLYQKGDKIILKENEQLVGEIIENTLLLKRNPKKHIMHRWNAYGINAEIIDSAEIEHVVITEVGEDGPIRELYISVKDIKAHGRFYKEPDHDAQYFVEIDLFKT